jgi:hypothetical protein
MRTLILSCLLAAASLAAGVAQAATIYTSRAAWLSAVSGVSTTTFEENGPGSFTSYGAQYNGAGFTVASSTNNIFTVDPGFASLYDWGSGDVLDMEFGIATITAGANFGFDFGNPASSSFFGSGLVTIGGVDYALLGQPAFNFFGVVGAAGPITVNFNGGLGIIDNFSTARSANAVPLPGSLALVLAGGLLMVGRRRA